MLNVILKLQYFPKQHPIQHDRYNPDAETFIEKSNLIKAFNCFDHSRDLNFGHDLRVKL